MYSICESQDDESFVLPVLLRFQGYPEVDDQVWESVPYASLYFSHVIKMIPCIKLVDPILELGEYYSKLNFWLKLC